MKNVLLLLSVVFSSLFSTVSLAQTSKSISKDDVLAIAQKQFVGKDVDYYILSNSTSAVHGQNIVMTDAGKLQTAILNRPVYRYSINTPTSTEDDHDFVGMDITSKAGNLADALGNNIYNVDSLVVRGTVDAADIRTL